MNPKDLEPFFGHTCTVTTAEREYKGVPDCIVYKHILRFLETFVQGPTVVQKPVEIPVLAIESIVNVDTGLVLGRAKGE